MVLSSRLNKRGSSRTAKRNGSFDFLLLFVIKFPSLYFQAQLRELRTEFDEAQHSWEQLEQEHLNLLRTLLPFSTANSLEDIIQEVTSHVNHLTGEIETLKQREEKPTG